MPRESLGAYSRPNGMGKVAHVIPHNGPLLEGEPSRGIIPTLADEAQARRNNDALRKAPRLRRAVNIGHVKLTRIKGGAHYFATSLGWSAGFILRIG